MYLDVAIYYQRGVQLLPQRSPTRKPCSKNSVNQHGYNSRSKNDLLAVDCSNNHRIDRETKSRNDQSRLFLPQQDGLFPAISCLLHCMEWYFMLLLTLITNALIKAAGIRSLYLLVTRQPPTMVAALLAKVY